MAHILVTNNESEVFSVVQEIPKPAEHDVTGAANGHLGLNAPRPVETAAGASGLKGIESVLDCEEMARS